MKQKIAFGLLIVALIATNAATFLLFEIESYAHQVAVMFVNLIF